MKIGFLMVATGEYTAYIDPLWQSIKKHARFSDATIHLFLFTDHPDLYSDSQITTFFQDHRPFPYPTLMRYHFFCKRRQELSRMDYLFYSDADMRFVNDFGDEILGDLVATLHPGFYSKKRNKFTYERDPRSQAYISYKDGLHYYCGGFNGGRTEYFIAMAEAIMDMVNKDRKKNIVAKWHDESYLNKYLLQHPPTKILSPSYCYAENMKLPFTPILLALVKDRPVRYLNVKKKILAALGFV
jgi:histo-blood group ABO system transferase